MEANRFNSTNGHTNYKAGMHEEEAPLSLVES